MSSSRKLITKQKLFIFSTILKRFFFKPIIWKVWPKISSEVGRQPEVATCQGWSGCGAPQVEKLMQCNSRIDNWIFMTRIGFFFSNQTIYILIFQYILLQLLIYTRTSHNAVFWPRKHRFACYSVEQSCISCNRKEHYSEVEATFWSSALYKVLGLCQALV